MPTGATRAGQKRDYAAIIDQDKVTQEVRDIALKYDPLNRSGREGFHVTDDGTLRIADANVIEEHKIIQNKIPNDAIRIVRLPAERGQLVHQHGENGFRLYELPAPAEGRIVGLLGPNGIGKTTSLDILAGQLTPNLGCLDDAPDWDEIVATFRGTGSQTHLTRLRDDALTTATKPQRIERLPRHHGGTLHEYIATHDQTARTDETLQRLQLDPLADRRLDELSGGELQRAALAATLVQQADLYLIDEPSSYLDVQQRLTAARALKDLARDARVVLVDHDLITLDIAADTVHLCYGDATNYGIVSPPMAARQGINRYLQGRLPEQNLLLRETAIDLTGTHRRRDPGAPVLTYPRLRKTRGTFTLDADPGTIHADQTLAILGQNGLGKTTYAKLLAGALDPDEDPHETELTVSYKPQLLEPTYEGTVQELFTHLTDVHDQAFRTEIHDPLSLEGIWEDPLETLSGGERQRVGIAAALARDAHLYLLDEPSAFLDVEQRIHLADTLERFVQRRSTPCLVIDHDLLLLDRVADRGLTFHGRPGDHGHAPAPTDWDEALNRFLEDLGITFRRDPDSGRPRANDPGSQKDREQRRHGDPFAG